VLKHIRKLAPMAATEHGISVDSERKSLVSHHTENHFTAGEIVRDIIIGVSDGLTVIH